MATTTPTTVTGPDGSTKFLTYDAMLNGEYGHPIPFAEWGDRSIEVNGTFGSGGNLRWEGSNKAAPAAGTAGDWFALNDPSSSALNITAAKVLSVLEVTRWARPRVTAGDGTTDLNVIVCLRRANNMRT